MEFWAVIGISWLCCGALAAMIAYRGGGNGTAGFWLGVLLGPLGVIAAFALGSPQGLERRALDLGESKTCPRCAETVKAAAQICRFCGHEFSHASEPDLEPDDADTDAPTEAVQDRDGYVIAFMIALLCIVAIGMAIALAISPQRSRLNLRSGEATAAAIAADAIRNTTADALPETPKSDDSRFPYVTPDGVDITNAEDERNWREFGTTDPNGGE